MPWLTCMYFIVLTVLTSGSFCCLQGAHRYWLDGSFIWHAYMCVSTCKNTKNTLKILKCIFPLIGKTSPVHDMLLILSGKPVFTESRSVSWDIPIVYKIYCSFWFWLIGSLNKYCTEAAWVKRKINPHILRCPYDPPSKNGSLTFGDKSTNHDSLFLASALC